MERMWKDTGGDQEKIIFTEKRYKVEVEERTGRREKVQGRSRRKDRKKGKASAKKHGEPERHSRHLRGIKGRDIFGSSSVSQSVTT